MQKLIITIAILLLSVGGLASQILEPVRWQFTHEKADDKEVHLLITATIDDNWYLYGQEIPEGGPIPTLINIDESEYFEFLGPVEDLIEPEIKFDPFFSMDLPLFSNEARFRQRVRILTDNEFAITGFVEFMSCDDERCLPPQEREFEFIIKEGPATAGATPEPSPTAPATPDVPEADEPETATGPETATETEPADKVEPIRKTVAVQPEETGTGTGNLWIFFFIAFAGGLAGLLTPCVFPMIPMTVSFFMQKQSGRLNAIINAFVFGISIIAVYTSLGLLVSLTSVGAGFANHLSSHWIPNMIFFLLFIAFAASFFGLFEIVLPGSLATKADRKAESGGYLGSFFMALTLVIVSLSCVGPIVGALLVEAAAGAGAKPVIGMFGFSLAFAVPFTMLAIFPSWLDKLPKSGGWLNSVKVVLGFIVLAFSLRFLMVVDQTYHWGILTRDVYLAIWIVIFTLLGFNLLGKLRFAHDSELQHISVPRLFLAIASFAFVVYMVPGLFGAPLKPLASLLPPQQSQSFDIGAMIRESGPGPGAVYDELCEEPRFADFLTLPHGLRGYFDLEQGLECAREQNMPVFLSFTGHSCSNCKEMEARVWSDRRVLQRLRNDYVIISLYVDDRTRLPEDEWITSETDGRVKNTIGRKNLDYQISAFTTNTQPYYVLMDAYGNLLAPARGYNLNTDAFADFLATGVENFSAMTVTDN